MIYYFRTSTDTKRKAIIIKNYFCNYLNHVNVTACTTHIYANVLYILCRYEKQYNKKNRTRLLIAFSVRLKIFRDCLCFRRSPDRVYCDVRIRWKEHDITMYIYMAVILNGSPKEPLNVTSYVCRNIFK